MSIPRYRQNDFANLNSNKIKEDLKEFNEALNNTNNLNVFKIDLIKNQHRHARLEEIKNLILNFTNKHF